MNVIFYFILTNGRTYQYYISVMSYYEMPSSLPPMQFSSSIMSIFIVYILIDSQGGQITTSKSIATWYTLHQAESRAIFKRNHQACAELFQTSVFWKKQPAKTGQGCR